MSTANPTAPFTVPRISGQLVRYGTVDTPADPGWAQPARHRSTAAGGGVERDDAPSGGGWVPNSWGGYPGQTVLTGEDRHRQESHSRYATHDGDQGRGDALPRNVLDSTDVNSLGDARMPIYGAGGAAHGGISPQGVSAPWAYPALSRRRADGGVVIRDGSMRAGQLHTVTTERHRQGLHMNRPTIRWVRDATVTVERRSPYPGSAQGAPRTSPFDPIVRSRTVGPVNPRTRRIMRPFGQTDTVDVDQEPGRAPEFDPGIIGSDWVL